MFSSVRILRSCYRNLCVKLSINTKLQNVTNIPKTYFHKSIKSNKSVSDVKTVYSLESDRFFKFVSVFGVLQTVFWFNVASIYFELPSSNSRENLNFIADFQQKHKTKFAVIGCFLGKYFANIELI